METQWQNQLSTHFLKHCAITPQWVTWTEGTEQKEHDRPLSHMGAKQKCKVSSMPSWKSRWTLLLPLPAPTSSPTSFPWRSMTARKKKLLPLDRCSRNQTLTGLTFPSASSSVRDWPVWRHSLGSYLKWGSSVVWVMLQHALGFKLQTDITEVIYSCPTHGPIVLSFKTLSPPKKNTPKIIRQTYSNTCFRALPIGKQI